MEYHEAVNALERLRRLRPKLGTETTASLLEHLGDPHEGVPAVQVAGSNGKGSTARLLERILREAGLDVGLYISPDLNDLRERVSVRGRKIPKREVVRFVEAAWPYVVERSVEGDAPTFFEAFTALALWHFGREDVDVAVLEVGIGGRYDATSVVDPVAAAVTSVSLEHTDLLGETVEEIARDKAHVAPADAPLVTGATGSALETIRERTDVVRVAAGDGMPSRPGDPPDPAPGTEPDVLATEGGMVSLAESTLSLSGPGWSVDTRTPLLGTHQAVNAGVAAVLARQVGAATGTEVTEGDLATGIRNVRWPGRFEVMADAPLVVLDGAHNPDACAKLSALVERFEYDGLHLVFGAMRDKDHAAMCRSLPAIDRVHLAEPAVDRAQGADALAVVFDRETDATIERHASVLDALDDALRDAAETDCVLVTGSLYTVGEARDRFTRSPTVVRADTPSRAGSVMERADVPAAVREERRDGVANRTVRLHARRSEAADLTETMLAAGGTGAVSGVTTADEHVAVVLSGTVVQFRRLASALRERGGSHAHIGSQLAETVGFEGTGVRNGNPAPGTEYPWTTGTAGRRVTRVEPRQNPVLPAVMGVLGVTPGSFDGGGTSPPLDDVVARAREMDAEGADVVDVVGNAIRTDGRTGSSAEERDRVVPVVERLGDLDAAVGVTTRRPSVAEAALDAGAEVVTDAAGLQDAGMREVVADRDVPVIALHRPPAPTATDTEVGGDVVGDAIEELGERVLLAERAGIERSRIVVGPTLQTGMPGGGTLAPLDRLSEYRALGTSLAVDLARRGPDEDGGGSGRLARTVASTALATCRGADVVRVRDVAEHVAAVDTAACAGRREE